MATWQDISRENWEAAKLARDRRFWRSCQSRCYYAIFSAVTHRLCEKRAAFGGGFETPRHQELRGLLKKCLVGELNPRAIGEIVSAVHRVYMSRIDADYRVGAFVDERTARNALRDGHGICRVLGVFDDAG
ncbi:MAG: HEPN domain-containing protein [Phycisphaerales bacterium]|nr:HEPN domain-containing protein [Phycisphaerales bacterium]